MKYSGILYLNIYIPSLDHMLRETTFLVEITFQTIPSLSKFSLYAFSSCLPTLTD